MKNDTVTARAFALRLKIDTALARVFVLRLKIGTALTRAFALRLKHDKWTKLYSHACSAD